MRKVTIPKSKFMIWLRTWNPSWFVNPFYSPSVTYFRWAETFGEDFIKGFYEGLRSKKGDDNV